MGQSTPRDGVSIAEVSKVFTSGQTQVPALADVSLSVERGEFVTVIGRSGCGKSTLLRVIAGLVDPDVGVVRIFGETPTTACARKQVGFVPQAPALLPWRTVLENARLPLEVNARGGLQRESGRDPTAILEAFGLGGVLDRHPADLSGGMAQRVAIARAFSFGPSLLLMDEPFSALDELTREELQRDLLVHWEKEHQTVIFVTHSVSEAILLGDRVVLLASGSPSVIADLVVDLPRPRPDLIELSEEFRELEARVRGCLRQGDGAPA